MALRLGILGGTFNPVHAGHIRLALEASERLGLDRVDLVPSAVPPHKSDKSILPYELRVQLLDLALPRRSRLFVSELEGVLEGPSYTFCTLQEYRRIVPEAELFFILGTKDLPTLPTWRRGLELPELAHLAVATRDDGLDEVQAFMLTHFPSSRRETADIWRFPSGTSLVYFSVPRLDISSTDIRLRWRRGMSLDGLVPCAVLDALHRREPDISRFWGPRNASLA